MEVDGFTLKKGKKKALGASAGFLAAVPATPQAPEKVFVTDFDPNAPAQLTEDGKKPLVIPLLETNAWTEAPKDSNKNLNKDKLGTSSEQVGTSADEQAAAQILAETQAAKNTNQDTDQKDLVIPIADEREKKRAELFQDGEKRPKSDQKKPILQQNAVPGLDELQDVTDKYRHDVALRPEAPDVHSDVYESVPVEAFGAALLRGMGWKGDVDPDDVGVAPQPRHKLLGLGATKRPTLPGEDKKKRRKRKDDTKDKQTDRRSGLNTDKLREERRENKECRSRRENRSPDRDRRRMSRSRSQSRSDRRKRSRSRDRDRRDRDRGDGRDRGRYSRSRSRSRSDRHSRRR